MVAELGAANQLQCGPERVWGVEVPIAGRADGRPSSTPCGHDPPRDTLVYRRSLLRLPLDRCALEQNSQRGDGWAGRHLHALAGGLAANRRQRPSRINIVSRREAWKRGLRGCSWRRSAIAKGKRRT
jgi:hypothetical protein